MHYSMSEENYIKTIYHLQSDGDTVSTNEVAASLQTKPASVTDMLKKLKAKKLLHYERYKGFRLSAEGKKVALGIVRRHRLWEFFLAEKLAFEWNEVHDLAEELEITAHALLVNAASWQYLFTVTHAGVNIASGRVAAIAHPAARPR